MACCGQKRAEPQRTTLIERVAPRPGTPIVSPAARRDTNARLTASGTEPSGAIRHHLVRVRYLQHSRILVRGTSTGREYIFSSGQPTQEVDPRDAEHLLRTGFFGRGW